MAIMAVSAAPMTAYFRFEPSHFDSGLRLRLEGVHLIRGDSPGVGAVCLNWARTDMCGAGQLGVPTAIADSIV